LRKIELPSEELAQELQRHLLERKLSDYTYDKGRRTVQFPDGVNASQWSNIRATVEKWAKGKDLDVVESLKIQSSKAEVKQDKVDSKEQKADIKKKVEKLSPEKAEERYRYLQSRPISELTDAEIEERLVLAQRPSEKD
jgi:hypothetical protein